MADPLTPSDELKQKLYYLDDTKELIKEAIIDKGQTVEEDTTFRDFADLIEGITTCVIDNDEYNECNAIAKRILGNDKSYTPLEYANIAFDTDYYMTSKSRVELEVEQTEYPEMNNNFTLLQSYDDVAGFGFTPEFDEPLGLVIGTDYSSSSMNPAKYYGYYSYHQMLSVDSTYGYNLIPLNTKVKLVVDSSGVSVNGNPAFINTDTTPFISKIPIKYLFSGFEQKVKFYDMKIYENTLMVRHYIPVEDSEHNVWIYDTVCNTIIETN